MADATSPTPPSPGLSATLLSNKSVEPYSLKGPENVKLTTLYRCTGRLFRIPPVLVAEIATVSSPGDFLSFFFLRIPLESSLNVNHVQG